MSAPVFYYDTNSPYAYLAAMRVDDLVPDVEWRPMAFGIVVRQTGKVPWSFGPERPEGQAEIERRAAERGLPPVRWVEGWPVEVMSSPTVAGRTARSGGSSIPWWPGRRESRRPPGRI